MLRFLRIRNLAVIASVEVEFEPGLNVLTGETGAGKSILVEAVGLLLGGRASADLVRTGETLATIEAIFEVPSGSPDELIVRREISSQGRSRSFINGALATAAALRDLSDRLVELHGQHEHQALLDPQTHLPLLDSYGGLDDLAARVASAWTVVRELRDQLDRSRMDTREKAARLDLITFQLTEIERAAPQPGEDEALAALKQVLASAERVQRLCDESYAALYESDGAVLATLGSVWKRVAELAAVDPQFSPYLDARDAIKSQLEDLAHFLRTYRDGVDASPDRLQEVEERLALIERLKRKYGPTLEEVIATGASLQRERDILTAGNDSTENLQRRLVDANDRFLAAARTLSHDRRTAARRLATALESLLADLAMARTRFEVRFNDRPLGEESWGERGIDQAEFFISPNPGEDLRPLARIVSGGELSRVMLALKTVAARMPTQASRARSGAGTRTLVFDEVDAGIGGRVADVVGAKLQNLGREYQVLCITHLPQIAARASTQFRITKEVRGNRTVTSVERLDPDGRVDEIARMIGGEALTDRIRASACELLDTAAAAQHGLASLDAPPRTAAAKGKQKAKGESESRRRS